MRKIRLEVEALAVESFSTESGDARKVGTVRGHEFTQFPACPPPSEMSNCATCLEGCPRDTLTCFASCRMTNGLAACIEPNCGGGID